MRSCHEACRCEEEADLSEELSLRECGDRPTLAQHVRLVAVEHERNRRALAVSRQQLGMEPGVVPLLL